MISVNVYMYDSVYDVYMCAALVKWPIPYTSKHLY